MLIKVYPNGVRLTYGVNVAVERLKQLIFDIIFIRQDGSLSLVRDDLNPYAQGYGTVNRHCAEVIQYGIEAMDQISSLLKNKQDQGPTPPPPNYAVVQSTDNSAAIAARLWRERQISQESERRAHAEWMARVREEQIRKEVKARLRLEALRLARERAIIKAREQSPHASNEELNSLTQEIYEGMKDRVLETLENFISTWIYSGSGHLQVERLIDRLSEEIESVLAPRRAVCYAFA